MVALACARSDHSDNTSVDNTHNAQWHMVIGADCAASCNAPDYQNWTESPRKLRGAIIRSGSTRSRRPPGSCRSEGPRRPSVSASAPEPAPCSVRSFLSPGTQSHTHTPPAPPHPAPLPRNLRRVQCEALPGIQSSSLIITRPSACHPRT